MKDLSDFIAMGEKLGLTTNDLATFARTEYDKYLKTLEIEKQEKERENMNVKDKLKKLNLNVNCVF